MNRFALLCALAAAALAAQAGSQQAPVFRGTADTVPVYVTVTDGSSRLVTTLTREDFTLLDNGRPQPLALFDNSPLPIHLVVMLDVSGSMYGNLPVLQAASAQLFDRLGPDDLARVGSFGHEITISPTFTRDAATLNEAVPKAIKPDAPTPLWAALDAALDALKGIQGRRVILVLSDGKDSGQVKWGRGFVTEIEIITRAQREEVMIYAVGLRSRMAPSARRGAINMAGSLLDDLPDPGLGSLAIETGAGYFEINAGDELGAAFARVADELHSQYVLGFSPPDRDGKRHKIEVRLRVKDLTPRARKNYYAPKAR